jgi:universal stress protein E
MKGEKALEKRKFLVVVDPSHEQHIALDRMVEIVRQQEDRDIEVHLYIGFESDDKSDPDLPEEVVCGREWRRELLRPLIELGVDFTAELFWTRHWRNSIVGAASRYDCDQIMLSKSSAENKRGMTDSKWELLRQADCDVVIVGSDSSGGLKSILACVDTQSNDSDDEAINQKVLGRGRYLADFFGAELHVVNAYTDSENFPDRGLIQRMSEVPMENIHRDMGKPEDVINDVAQKINADIVILGTKSRHSIRAKLRGNTSEKVMDKMNIDVLALN